MQGHNSVTENAIGCDFDPHSRKHFFKLNLYFHFTVPIFRRIPEAFRVEWQNSTPRFASTPERRNKNIKYSRMGIEAKTFRVYNHTLALAPLLAWASTS